MKVPQWIKDLWTVAPEPPKMIQVGIVERDGFLVVVDTDAQIKGETVKLATLDELTLAKYHVATGLFIKMQKELQAFPRSLRPRRKSSRSVSTGAQENANGR